VGLPLSALRMALDGRSPSAGLVHHSDRGSVYASKEYTDLLKEHGAVISMSRRGNPYDNAGCESFIKTLKYEEVYRQEYRDLAEAKRLIARFIEQVYNERRLHSALGYRPPVEFEKAFAGRRVTVGSIRAEGPRKAFSGMTESIVPAVSSLLFTPGACPASRSGRCQGIGHTGKNMPCPSVLMSSGRLFLAGWSPPLPAALRRQAQNNLLACSTASVYHRMAPSVLTVLRGYAREMP
jgi:hypothetical protein